MCESKERSAEYTERLIRAGAHLHGQAKSMGWPDDGEGAYEFIVRTAYEQGLRDATTRGD